jgi:hypothetical protein
MRLISLTTPMKESLLEGKKIRKVYLKAKKMIQ